MPFLDEKGLARFWKNIKEYVNSTIPTVEEYDTADGWHVRKHSDGYVEMTTKMDCPWGNSRQWGSLYVQEAVAGTGHKAFPITLTEKYSELSSVQAGGGTFIPMVITAGSLTQTCAYGLVRGTTAIGYVPVITVVVTGRWK